MKRDVWLILRRFDDAKATVLLAESGIRYVKLEAWAIFGSNTMLKHGTVIYKGQQ